MNGNNVVLRRYVYGPGIDTPLMVLEGSTKKYLHKDGKGSMIAATSAAGAVTNKFTADVYGQGADEATSPYRFTARRVDEETGNYYYRNRYYNPRQGRFMSQDPIGYADGLNMYAYVQNDPVNNVDPMGLDDEPTVVPSEPGTGKAGEDRTNWVTGIWIQRLLDQLKADVVTDFSAGLGRTHEAFRLVTEQNMEICAGLISLIGNQTISAQEVFDATGYDPNGPSQDQVLSDASWVEYIRAGSVYYNGINQTELRFPNQPLGDSPADAWRHAYSSALLTRTAGAEFAQEVFDAHERESGQREGRLMDLINNHNGRYLANNLNGQDVAAAIHSALSNGLLITTPPIEMGNATGNLVCTVNP
ncbi:MAG: RHS repeat-associated core domain-containing protein [Kordiimonas sp.]